MISLLYLTTMTARMTQVEGGRTFLPSTILISRWKWLPPTHRCRTFIVVECIVSQAHSNGTHCSWICARPGTHDVRSRFIYCLADVNGAGPVDVVAAHWIFRLLYPTALMPTCSTPSSSTQPESLLLEALLRVTQTTWPRDDAALWQRQGPLSRPFRIQ